MSTSYDYERRHVVHEAGIERIREAFWIVRHDDPRIALELALAIGQADYSRAEYVAGLFEDEWVCHVATGLAFLAGSVVHSTPPIWMTFAEHELRHYLGH